MNEEQILINEIVMLINNCSNKNLLEIIRNLLILQAH